MKTPNNTVLAKTIGARAKRTRLLLGESMECIAESAGVSAQTIKMLERGLSNARIFNLVNIAGALGVPVAYLCGGSEPNSPSNLLMLFNSLSPEKQDFAEKLLYQIKATPYDFVISKK